ncbi:MAG: hypothetical protein L6R36_007339 [Xanthoria steineri]|nr:MAG: hypothetical protein L6R36_007339 [Xanthoria steineri]
MSPPKLILYLDIVSPFAYLAYHVIRHSPVFAKCEIEYVPVFLGGIMKACGNTPPIKIKNKGAYMNHERLRWARLFDVPMKETTPPGFPANTLPVQRVLTAVSMLFPQRLAETCDAIYQASFVHHHPVHEQACLLGLLENVHGKDQAQEIIRRSTSDEVKRELTARTDEVISKGSFGLPWYIATNAQGEVDHFWGFDNIGAVANHLGLEKLESGSTGRDGWRSML